MYPLTHDSASPEKDSGEVCIIETDEGIGELLVELLENQFSVRSFNGLADFEKTFLDASTPLNPELILCDANLHDGSGIAALRTVRKRDPILPFVFLVSQPDAKWTAEAFEWGVTDLIEKPFESILFVEKFRGRIAQAKMLRAKDEFSKLLQTQNLLTTTYVNRLIDSINVATGPVTGKTSFTKLKKLAYSWPDEDEIRFQHARKSEEKLLIELERCRIEYLALARTLGIF